MFVDAEFVLYEIDQSDADFVSYKIYQCIVVC